MLTALQRDSYYGETMMVDNARRNRALYLTMHGQEIYYTYAEAYRELESMGDPILMHALAHVQHTAAQLDYEHRYFGFTECSDMIMDTRTFAMPDVDLSERGFDPGSTFHDDIYEDPVFQLFYRTMYRGAPYPEPELEPGALEATATAANSPDDTLQERQRLKKSRRVQDLSCCSTPQLNTEQGKYQSQTKIHTSSRRYLTKSVCNILGPKGRVGQIHY